MKSEYEIQKEQERIKTNLAEAIRIKNKASESWIRGYIKALSWILE